MTAQAPSAWGAAGGGVIFIVVLFAIPALGWGCAYALMQSLETSEAAAHAAPLSALCPSRPFQWMSADLCGPYQHAQTLRDASIGVAASIVTASLLIILAGALARRSERFLTSVFAPATRLLIVSLALIILLQGAIAAYSFFNLLDHLASLQLIMPAVSIWAAAAAAYLLLQNVVTVFRSEPLKMRAIELTSHTQPALWQSVGNIARAADAPMPAHIVAGIDDSFFVAAIPIALRGGETLHGETLYLSLGLMRILDVEELRAVIAHELAHFKARDAQWTVGFAPTFLALNDVVGRMDDRKNSWVAVGMIPATLLITLFMSQFAVAERYHRRRRELEADRIRASIAGATALASALLRLVATHNVMRALSRAIAERKLDAKQAQNLSRFFAFWAADYLAKQDTAAILAKLATARLPHPVDTHPRLRDRLVALGLNATAETAWLQLPAETASHLIDGVDEIEERLSREETEFFTHIDNMPLQTKPVIPG